MEDKCKLLFIVSNTPQTEMFAPIARELPDWDILCINKTRGDNRVEIEKVLQKIGFSYKTIGSYSGSKVKKIIDREQPNMVVVGNDSGDMERLFIKYANSMGIPTLLVQDGILTHGWWLKDISASHPHLKFFFSLPWRLLKLLTNKRFSWHQKFEILRFEPRYGAKGKPGVYGHGESLRIAVFGSRTKELLTSEGVEPERIIVTGNPKFDRLYHYEGINCKQRICQRWQIPIENDFLILLTAGYVEVGVWSTEQRRQFILAITKAVTALPNTKLIIKLHPSEKESDYREIVKDLGYMSVICRDVDLGELLNACSLAISVSSTTALEAMALQKPVVMVNLFNPGSSFYQGSGALYVSKEGDILPAIKQALYNTPVIDEMRKSIEKFVYEQVYLPDGQAAKRIAELILSMTTRQG